jgi:hypothetical protein
LSARPFGLAVRCRIDRTVLPLQLEGDAASAMPSKLRPHKNRGNGTPSRLRPGLNLISQLKAAWR